MKLLVEQEKVSNAKSGKEYDVLVIYGLIEKTGERIKIKTVFLNDAETSLVKLLNLSE